MNRATALLLTERYHLAAKKKREESTPPQEVYPPDTKRNKYFTPPREDPGPNTPLQQSTYSQGRVPMFHQTPAGYQQNPTQQN